MSELTAERTAELAELRAAVRDLTKDAGGPAATRHAVDAGARYDAASWQLIGQEMGLAGLGLPEALGGAGGELAELLVVSEELGRSLLAVPFFSSTVLAGQVLAGCGEAAADVIGAVASGASLVSFCGLDADGAWNPAAVPVTAAAGDSGVVLDGDAGLVLDGADADQFVVAASGPEGCDLYLVSADAPGVSRRAVETLDLSRSQAAVTFAGAPAVALTSNGAGGSAVTAAVDVALVVLAAEQVGGAQACLDLSVDYAKIRHQFSRPLGSFQAIKHKLADMLLLVELGRSAVDRALTASDDPAAFAEAAAVAAAWCSDAFVSAATETVQVHGGIGFTWEHDAHLYFRRARADAALLGDATYHRERLATLLDW